MGLISLTRELSCAHVLRYSVMGSIHEGGGGGGGCVGPYPPDLLTGMQLTKPIDSR